MLFQDAITAINTTPIYENQSKPWTQEEEAYLQEAFHAGVEVKEMSETLKRTRDAIRARLKKLGLAE